MSEAYAIGVTLGLGVAAGILLAALLAAWRHGLVVSVLGAVAIGVVAGLLVRGWIGLPGGVVGGVLGAVSASFVVRGAIGRGATAGGTAFILGAAAIVIGLLSLVPVVGYVVTVAVPLVAVRRARRAPERYAGLRTLAK